ncbi:MAG: S49 family peptidase [Candidatus Delongbacteria bacterium]
MKRLFLGVFLGLLLAVGLLVAGVWGLMRMAGGQELQLADNSLLVLDWSGPLPGHQIHPADADFGTPVTLSHVSAAIREAAGRPEITGILIERNLELPREYLQELGGALESFRQAGKPVWAHLELGYGSSYLAACLADTLALSPSASGGLILPGPSVSRLYMSEALKRLGVRMHVLHQGDAKSYGEEYIQQTMSPAVRENLGLLVEDLLGEELAWIGARRHVEPARLRQELGRPERVWLSPSEARGLGLVDTLLSRADWDDAVEARFPGHSRLSISDWIGSRRQLPSQGEPKITTQDHVAVLWAEGNIVPGLLRSAQVQVQSRAMIEQIRDLQESDAVKAVVLRVESPGGSALASEEIYQELVKLAKVKPLWISAGPVAASGGYYLALPGAQIWASPFSVLGSIGVVALVPDLSGAAGKLGLNPQGIHPLPAAKLGDLGSPVEASTLAAMNLRLGEVYAEFRSRVLAHRPLSAEQLTPVAGGRVWSGRRAVELGLADQLGDLQDCLDSLQATLGATPLPVSQYPRQESLLSLLLSGHLKPRDLLPGAQLSAGAKWLGMGDFVGQLEEEPARLGDPFWTLRAEESLLLR